LRKKYIEICKSKTGAKNNAYNTVWVNDGNKSFKVKKGSVLEHDWSLGRVKKKNIVQFAAPK
jgi:predicted alpha/beta superfamily hydrolase